MLNDPFRFSVMLGQSGAFALEDRIMRRSIAVTVAAGLALAVLMPGASADQAQGPGHRASKHYRHHAPQVRGYVVCRGGYSYSAEDSINTYGDSRSKYGGTS